jgi:hypothetical protein
MAIDLKLKLCCNFPLEEPCGFHLETPCEDYEYLTPVKHMSFEELETWLNYKEVNFSNKKTIKYFYNKKNGT